MIIRDRESEYKTLCIDKIRHLRDLEPAGIEITLSIAMPAGFGSWHFETCFGSDYGGDEKGYGNILSF
jgi:hypothetical protein